MNSVRPRVVFGLMSAQQSAATVEQLVDALGAHPVVIHHDYRKLANFAIARPNVTILPDPSETGWGTWGFAQGILKLLEYCLDNFDFEYFQLLSPTCLPLRPIDDYIAYLGEEGADIYADLIDISNDEEAMVNYGFRAFVPGPSLRQKLLRRARSWYFGSGATLVQTQSLAVLHRSHGHSGPSRAVAGSTGLAITRIAANGWFGRRPHSNQWCPVIGSVWFCASRKAGRRLLEMAAESEVARFYRRLSMVDESMLPTLMANSGLRIHRSNHAVSAFTLEGHPRWVTSEADLDALTATGRFFGRKFPDDPSAPMRLRVLQRLRGAGLVPSPHTSLIADSSSETHRGSQSQEFGGTTNIAVPSNTTVPGFSGDEGLRGAALRQRASGDRASEFSAESESPFVPSKRYQKSPRIIFGVMSAVAKVATVKQLADSLYPYQVVVHHDFSQQPEFPLRTDNASLVPHPKRTGYGVWSFTEGVIRLLEHCLNEYNFDYFQLLSPACLPIKPLSEFSAYVAESNVDVNSEFIDLRLNRDAMMCFGPRVYAPNNSLRRAILQRARAIYLGPSPRFQGEAGVQIACRRSDLRRSLAARGAYAVMWSAQQGWFGTYTPEPTLQPKIGGAWFGANRMVCEYLVRRIKDSTVYEHYKRFNDFGETAFNTVIGNSNFRFGPFNTYVTEYQGWHPRPLELNDLDHLRRLPHFFARKFPDDPDAPIRQAILESIRTKH